MNAYVAWTAITTETTAHSQKYSFKFEKAIKTGRKDTMRLVNARNAEEVYWEWETKGEIITPIKMSGQLKETKTPRVNKVDLKIWQMHHDACKHFVVVKMSFWKKQKIQMWHKHFEVSEKKDKHIDANQRVDPMVTKTSQSYWTEQK